MNIFYLDHNPRICAQMHYNKHIVKMPLESTQLLRNAYPADTKIFENAGLKTYKITHYNHPSSKWTRESINNFKWHIHFALELCREYTARYGKIHSCCKIIMCMAKNLPDLPDIPFFEPYQAMPEEFKHESSIVAYRNYYRIAKSHLRHDSYPYTI